MALAPLPGIKSLPNLNLLEQHAASAKKLKNQVLLVPVNDNQALNLLKIRFVFIDSSYMLTVGGARMPEPAITRAKGSCFRLMCA